MTDFGKFSAKLRDPAARRQRCRLELCPPSGTRALETSTYPALPCRATVCFAPVGAGSGGSSCFVGKRTRHFPAGLRFVPPLRGWCSVPIINVELVKFGGAGQRPCWSGQPVFFGDWWKPRRFPSVSLKAATQPMPGPISVLGRATAPPAAVTLARASSMESTWM
jgi:hypothetical protein